MLSLVVILEPTRVVVGFYIDWFAFAYVTLNLRYTDGTVTQEEFRFRAQTSGSGLLPLVGEISDSNQFGPLYACFKESPTNSYCSLVTDVRKIP